MLHGAPQLLEQLDALARRRHGRVHPQPARGLEFYDGHPHVGRHVAEAEPLRLLEEPDGVLLELGADGLAVEEGAQGEREARDVEVEAGRGFLGFGAGVGGGRRRRFCQRS